MKLLIYLLFLLIFSSAGAVEYSMKMDCEQVYNFSICDWNNTITISHSEIPEGTDQIRVLIYGFVLHEDSFVERIPGIVGEQVFAPGINCQSFRKNVTASYIGAYPVTSIWVRFESNVPRKEIGDIVLIDGHPEQLPSVIKSIWVYPPE